MGTITETIFVLSLRQSLTLRRLIVLLLVASIPLALALISWLGNRDAELSNEDMQYFIQAAVTNITLPLIALIVAARAFADEIEDNTLTNLILSPISRWQIVLPKVVAAVTVVAIPIAITVFISVLILLRDGDYTPAIVAAFGMMIGATAFVSLFACVGVFTTRAVVFGIIYVFAFEALISSVVPGLKYVSISGITLSIMSELDPSLVVSDTSGINQLPPLIYSIIALLVVIIGCNLATVWRLKRMDVH